MSVTVSCAFILEVEPEGKKEKKKKKEEEEIVSYHLLHTRYHVVHMNVL